MSRCPKLPGNRGLRHDAFFVAFSIAYELGVVDRQVEAGGVRIERDGVDVGRAIPDSAGEPNLVDVVTRVQPRELSAHADWDCRHRASLA